MGAIALEWVWLEHVCYALMFAAAFLAFYMMLQAWPRRRRRWPNLAWNKLFKVKTYPAGWLKLFGIRADAPGLEHKRQLLARSGFQMDAVGYELVRRLLLGFACGLMGIGAAIWKLQEAYGWIQPVYVILLGAVAAVLLGADQVVLESVGKRRAQSIMKEIYVLSNQLLYYNGSRQSLHAKLSRCLPFTHVIRGELDLLLNEWYTGAEQAIRQFKQRLGTDEAFSFAETINSIRLYENDNYYALLRQRVQDYKEMLELAKDSRKETTSYALFILAGLPIMNTFRIFIYPWVMEGQKLFQQLQ